MSIEVTVEYAHREWDYYDNVVHIRNYKQLQAKVAELEEEIERLRADNIAFARNLKGKSATTGATYEHICAQLAKAEQRVAEACALQVATETKFHWLDAARVAKEIRSGEWRKFVKEV